MENWLPLPGFEGRYEVSDLGRVKSLPSGRIIAQAGSAGYRAVNLRHGKFRQAVHVHRLVLRTFVGPPPPKHESRHLDGDRAHNALSNLKYGTRSENNIDMIAHGRSRAKISPETARAILAWPKGKRGLYAAFPMASVNVIDAIRSRHIWKHL